MALIFDIETIGEDFETMDETTQENLTRWLKREAYDEEEYKVALKDLKEGLGFSPLTGQIVAIGVLDAEKAQGVVYFQGNENSEPFEEKGFKFKPMNEAEMLGCFWKGALRYQEFVSFNGRSFDVPFLMVRSAVHRLKPTKDLMSNRYLNSQKYDAKHIDLADQLSFYGAARRKGSLHLYCRALGIQSPKSEGVTGDDVAGLFKEGRFSDIARYNARDLAATMELYGVWKEFFNIRSGYTQTRLDEPKLVFGEAGSNADGR